MQIHSLPPDHRGEMKKRAALLLSRPRRTRKGGNKAKGRPINHEEKEFDSWGRANVRRSERSLRGGGAPQNS